MSSLRKSARMDVPGTKRFVVLRGGLEKDGPTARDRDWDAFCSRIGWQGNASEQGKDSSLPDDYEDRLAERIAVRFQLENALGTCADDVYDDAGATADWTAYPSDERRISAGLLGQAAWTRAGMAVAGVFCILAASMASLSGEPAAVLAPQDPEPVELAPPAPIAPAPRMFEHDDSVEPEERAVPDSDVTIPPKPVRPPGARLVAQERTRASRGVHAETLVAQTGLEAAMEPLAAPSFAGAAPGFAARPGRHDATAPVEVAAREQEQTVETVLVSHALPVPRLDSESVVSTASFVRASAPANEPREGRRLDLSISESTRRWYGVSFADNPTPSSYPAGVGVVAQVDVARAVRAF